MRPCGGEPFANGLPFSTASSTSPRQSTNVVAPDAVAEKVIRELVRSSSPDASPVMSSSRS